MCTKEEKEHMDFVLNLEILDGCKHHCEGCYVSRRHNSGIDLKHAVSMAKDLVSRGLRFRECIISPTDMFSSDNVEEVLRNPDFIELLNVHPITRITSASMFENTDIEDVKRVFSILDTENYREDMIIEFFVPMNVEKLLAHDEEYFSQIHKVVEFLKTGTPKIVDWSMVVNIHFDKIFQDNLDELTTIVRDEFDTIIEYVPSFFRPGKEILAKQQLKAWGEMMKVVINEDNFKNIMFTTACKKFNALNTLALNYRKGKMFISPFIYEQILWENPVVDVTNMSTDDLLALNNRLIVDQYNYAAKTSECSNCSLLSTCVGRNVLTYMETVNEKNCLFPKDVYNMYYDRVIKDIKTA